MGAYPITIGEVLNMLREQPLTIAAVTAGLTEPQLRQRPNAEGWSCADILGHLRTSADGWDWSIDTILGTAQPEPPDTAFVKIAARHQGMGFEQSLSAYQQQRARLLATLEALPAEAWERAASERDARVTPARTLSFFVQKLARHERTHVAHLRQTVRRLKR